MEERYLLGAFEAVIRHFQIRHQQLYCFSIDCVFLEIHKSRQKSTSTHKLKTKMNTPSVMYCPSIEKANCTYKGAINNILSCYSSILSACSQLHHVRSSSLLSVLSKTTTRARLDWSADPLTLRDSLQLGVGHGLSGSATTGEIVRRNRRSTQSIIRMMRCGGLASLRTVEMSAALMVCTQQKYVNK